MPFIFLVNGEVNDGNSDNIYAYYGFLICIAFILIIGPLIIIQCFHNLIKSSINYLLRRLTTVGGFSI